jgi:ferric-dicitrate binding protein FerR (iron transport regulator)
VSASVWIVAVAMVVELTVTPRSIKQLRRRDEGFVREWRTLEPEHRRAIQRALRAREAVHGEDDARLAIAAAAQVDRVRAAMRPTNSVASLMFVALLFDGAFSGSH